MRAFEEARAKGLRTVALTGETGGDMLPLVDVCIRVPSTSTPRIQECHITLGHIVCGLVEQLVFPQEAAK
jgi:D-sedoheptulose 7-phosphate isomerase